MTNWERRQKLFDKAYDTYEKGKDSPSFWEYVSKELGKLDSDPQTWKEALLRCQARHAPKPIPTFDNCIPDSEVDRIISEAR